MSTEIYQAKILFEAYEDSQTEGETTECSNYWDTTLTATSKAELRDKIAQATYSKWEEIDQNDANDYPTQTEYWADYMATEDNDGCATQSQLQEFKEGKCRLWAIHCHILVSKLAETRTTL